MTEEFEFASGRRCGISNELMRCHLVTTTTLVVASLAIAAAGAAAGAYSSVQAADQQEKASKYNAAVDRNNALNASRAAKYQADRIAKRNRLIAGKQRAGYAKAGIDLSGSAEDVMMDSAIEGELDRQVALYSGLTAAQSNEARARLSEFEGSSAKRAGYVRAGASVLGGASQGAGIYTNYRNNQEPDF